jgi:hypothetical protein
MCSSDYRREAWPAQPTSARHGEPAAEGRPTTDPLRVDDQTVRLIASWNDRAICAASGPNSRHVRGRLDCSVGALRVR